MTQKITISATQYGGSQKVVLGGHDIANTLVGIRVTMRGDTPPSVELDVVPQEVNIQAKADVSYRVIEEHSQRIDEPNPNLLDLSILSAPLRDVIELMVKREEVGKRKYGTTLDRKDLTDEQWTQHLQEELMDALLYAQKRKHNG